MKTKTLLILLILEINANAIEVEGGLGFKSFFYAFNKEAWSEFHKGRRLLNGKVKVGLQSPKQIVFLHNAWYLLAAYGEDDGRVVHLKKHILHEELNFASEWPQYSAPGFIAAVRNPSGDWILVIEMGKFFLIEKSNAIGVVEKDNF